MATWHDRLQTALDARGVEWLEFYNYLHKRTSITKQSVYAWKPEAERRSTMMNADNSVVACEWLKISPLWLFFGEGSSGLEKENKTADLIAALESLPEDKRATAEQMVYGLVALEEATKAASSMQQQPKKKIVE